MIIIVHEYFSLSIWVKAAGWSDDHKPSRGGTT
jgi:hypothetical protein